MALFDIILLILLIIGIVTVAVIQYASYIVRKKIYEIPEDGIIIDIFETNKTEGYSLGIMRPDMTKYGDEGRKTYSYVTRDLDKDEEPKIKDIITSKRFELFFPKGTWSKARNRLWILPTSPERLPQPIRDNSIIGTTLTTAIILKKIEKNMEETWKAGSDAQAKLIKRFQAGEITQETIDQLKPFIEQMIIKTMEKNK